MNRFFFAPILLVFTTIFSVHAQHEKTTIYTENIQAYINTDFLITGETLYFSIHCLNAETNQYSKLSKVAYVELIGENAKPFLQIKVPLTDGRGAGDFFLPSTLPSGNYTFIAYTKWMRNFETEDFFQQQITIVNPYLKQPSETKALAKATEAIPASRSIKKETKQVQLSSDQQKYSLRQKVTVTIKNNDPLNECKMSLNVHKYEPGISNTNSSGSSAQKPVPQSKKKFAAILPDLRGETIGGIVKEASSGRTVANVTVYLSIPGSSNIFQISKTDSTGRFYFTAKNIYALDGILFQVDPASAAAPISITLDDEFINDYTSFKPQPLSIDTSWRARIEQRNIYGQIENAYYIKKRDSILTQVQKPFFGTPDKVYKLDDFTRFPTMEDIFREYMYEVAVSKRDGKFLLRLLNSTTKNGARFVSAPLLLVDGIPIFDTEILMSYNPLLIKTVSFITRPYVYGGTLYDGIISANTYTGNAKELMVKPIRKDFTSWQHSKNYFSPLYGTSEVLARIPDYRIQLFWNPAITIAPSQEMTFEFFSSDVEGVFLVEASGFNSIGEAIKLSQKIEIRK